MGDFPNLNSIFVGLLAIFVFASQVYGKVTDNTKSARATADQIRTDIITDYRTRLEQVEANMAVIQKENHELKGQLLAIKDLPLQRIDASIALMVKQIAELQSALAKGTGNVPRQ